jgi:hypothetical protein
MKLAFLYAPRLMAIGVHRSGAEPFEPGEGPTDLYRRREHGKTVKTANRSKPAEIGFRSAPGRG